MEGAGPFSGAGRPVGCALLIPQHPSSKRGRSGTGQSAGKSLGHLGEGPQSPGSSWRGAPEQMWPHRAAPCQQEPARPWDLPCSLARSLVRCSSGRGVGCTVWEPTVDSCTPTWLGREFWEIRAHSSPPESPSSFTGDSRDSGRVAKAPWAAQLLGETLQPQVGRLRVESWGPFLHSLLPHSCSASQ